MSKQVVLNKDGTPRKETGWQKALATQRANAQQLKPYVPAPKEPLDLAVQCRRRSLRMVQTLYKMAIDKDVNASARVAAARTILDFAKMEPSDMAKLSDAQVEKLISKVAKMRQRKVVAATETEVTMEPNAAQSASPQEQEPEDAELTPPSLPPPSS